MKKKYRASFKEKKEWIEFTKKMGTVADKDQHYSKNNTNKNIIKKIDLHGFSLEEANKIVKKFIINSYELGHLKLLIILGKGSRSKVYDDPYRSKDMNILKNSVPEYIKNDSDLSDKILKISEADVKDGGKGAIYIFLKNNKKL